jgi:hypothetical protein
LYFANKRIFVRTITKLLLLGFVIVFTACQKDKDSARGSTTNIEGDYDFVGIVAYTESSVTVNRAGTEIKAVTVYDYATKNNSGTTKITSNQLIGTNLDYSIDTIFNVKTYWDNVLVDDSDFPSVGSTSPTSSNSTYVRNSADSITVTRGAPDIVSGLFNAIPIPPAPPAPQISTGFTNFAPEKMGIKLSWSGDTLSLKVNSSYSQSVIQFGGPPGTLVGSVNGIIRLRKH